MTPATIALTVAGGYVLSEYAPMLANEPVAGIRVGTIIGAYLFLRGRTMFQRFLGLGMLLPDVKDAIAGVAGPTLAGLDVGSIGGAAADEGGE